MFLLTFDPEYTWWDCIDHLRCMTVVAYGVQLDRFSCLHQIRFVLCSIWYCPLFVLFTFIKMYGLNNTFRSFTWITTRMLIANTQMTFQSWSAVGVGHWRSWCSNRTEVPLVFIVKMGFTIKMHYLLKWGFVLRKCSKHTLQQLQGVADGKTVPLCVAFCAMHPVDRSGQPNRSR